VLVKFCSGARSAAQPHSPLRTRSGGGSIKRFPIFQFILREAEGHPTTAGGLPTVQKRKPDIAPTLFAGRLGAVPRFSRYTFESAFEML
jgi:hypothetical protein